VIVLVSLKVLVRLCNTLPCVKRYVMEPNVFLGYLERGIACSLSFFEHEQYPFNILNQNNSAHGVYNVAH
jgi:hypothetical protein